MAPEIVPSPHLRPLTPLGGSQSLGPHGHHRTRLSLRSPGTTARHPAGLLGSSHVPFLCPLPPEVASSFLLPSLPSLPRLIALRPPGPPSLLSRSFRRFLLPMARTATLLSAATCPAPRAPSPDAVSCVLRGALRGRPGPRRPLVLHGLLRVHAARSWPAHGSCFLRAVFIYSLDFDRRPLLCQAQGMKEGAACVPRVHGWGDKTFPVCQPKSSQAAWSPPKGQRLLPASPAAHPRVMTSWALLGESTLLMAADCCLRHAWGLGRPRPRLRGAG